MVCAGKRVVKHKPSKIRHEVMDIAKHKTNIKTELKPLDFKKQCK